MSTTAVTVPFAMVRTAPLLSSGLLIAFGKAELTPGLILACGLITLGSLLSALDRLKSMLIKR
jgi:hypothetical protein